ncbi:hypothetical protein P40081_37350 [Paenibacillus sp. FSL P4-0081]|uniref:hypothetical protein n=1 Tax=Paenibacillus sp. FSL P4-0081 TaxID=1536769 RepID=UPI0004F6E24C|nr:hypothetical protein [Paenibacillus sp. FSL P4-0081]AIQ33152.1 hypothetical protein P40081_37350 [Paenibacillus sp. FSL P4-0081]
MKLMKRTLGICLIVVLASGLSMLTTAYVVNTYIQSVLAGFDIKVDGPEPGMLGFVKSLTGMGSSSSSSTDTKDTKDTIKEADSSKVDGEKGTGGDSPASETGDTVDETVPEDALPEDALPVMGQAAAGEEQSDRALDQELVMTPGALNDLKENIPADEKSNIFNILMNKLPQEEMLKISSAMEGGLTESEVKELQEIIARYVDEEEYESLMKMLTPDSAPPTQN